LPVYIAGAFGCAIEMVFSFIGEKGSQKTKINFVILSTDLVVFESVKGFLQLKCEEGS
jgi:hypothetical protein